MQLSTIKPTGKRLSTSNSRFEENTYSFCRVGRSKYIGSSFDLIFFRNVNNDVMELLILIYACKTSMSKTITVIMPYLPYSKQCRMLRRSSIPMKLIAEMICKAGGSSIILLFLQCFLLPRFCTFYF